jgi:hypothetical protein
LNVWAVLAVSLSAAAARDLQYVTGLLCAPLKEKKKGADPERNGFSHLPSFLLISSAARGLKCIIFIVQFSVYNISRILIN